MKKVKSIADIKADPRIYRVKMDYDGKGRHMVECKEGFRFESCNSSMEVGNVKELCYEINNRLDDLSSFSCENEERGGPRCADLCPDCSPKYMLAV